MIRAAAQPDHDDLAGIRLLTAAQVAEALAIDRRSLLRHVAAGDFPRPLHIGRSARWKVTDVRAHLDALASGGRRR